MPQKMMVMIAGTTGIMKMMNLGPIISSNIITRNRMISTKTLAILAKHPKHSTMVNFV